MGFGVGGPRPRGFAAGDKSPFAPAKNGPYMLTMSTKRISCTKKGHSRPFATHTHTHTNTNRDIVLAAVRVAVLAVAAAAVVLVVVAVLVVVVAAVVAVVILVY